MDKIIQIANLLPSGDSHNSLPGRVYYPKGVCPCLRTPTGGAMPTNVFMDKTKVTPPSCATPSDGATTAMGPRMCMEASTARADFTSIRTLAA